MKKLHRKDFSIAVKKGTDANKSKFAKEAVLGEMYYATDTGSLYVANNNAGSSDALLTKYQQSGLILTNNYSLRFDGSDDYLAIPNTASELNFSGDMSISFWVKYTNISSGYQFIIDKSTASTDRHYSLYLRNGTGGTKLISFNNTTGSGFSTSTQSIAVNTWNHVVLSCQSGVAGGTKLYVNGNVETLSSTHTVVSNNSAPLQFGKRDDALYELEGLMDDVAIFNSALSASDITAIYNNGTPNHIGSFNPVGWWRMGDNNSGTGTTITDQGSGGNDATLVNGPTFSTDTP